jgi:hypothetical protein
LLGRGGNEDLVAGARFLGAFDEIRRENGPIFSQKRNEVLVAHREGVALNREAVKLPPVAAVWSQSGHWTRARREMRFLEPVEASHQSAGSGPLATLGSDLFGQNGLIGCSQTRRLRDLREKDLTRRRSVPDADPPGVIGTKRSVGGVVHRPHTAGRLAQLVRAQPSHG